MAQRHFILAILSTEGSCESENILMYHYNGYGKLELGAQQEDGMLIFVVVFVF